MRKLTWVCLACLGIAVAAFASPASAASAGGCDLKGTANFSPGLNSSGKPFSYNFGGDLSGCRSSEAGAPESGSVGAGQTLNELVTNSITGATDTVTYQEPEPTGSGGCASSTTSGQALVTWADGTHTVFSYATTGALAAVKLTGSVVPSMTLNAVNPQAGDPGTFTIATSRYSGDATNGLLFFEPPEPTACTTETGVTVAGISGAVGLSGS